MAGVQKVMDPGLIPANVLGDLEALVPAKNKDYVVIGANYYELYPTPAIQLLGVLGDFIEIVDAVRVDKIAALRKQKENVEKDGGSVPWANLDLEAIVGVTFQDLLTNANGLARIREILTKVLEGVDDEDFKDMGLGQLSLIMTKLVSVNLATLPPSFRKVFEDTTRQMTGVDVASLEKAAAEAEEAPEDATKNP
jgi:hypothetical protein